MRQHTHIRRSGSGRCEKKKHLQNANLSGLTKKSIARNDMMERESVCVAC